MLFEVDELHIYREPSKIIKENTSFKERDQKDFFSMENVFTSI